MAGRSPCGNDRTSRGRSREAGPEAALLIDVTYDPELDAYHAHCDWSQVSPSLAIVEMITAITDRSELEMPPLVETVDPDAVDAILSGSTADGAVTRVQFEYEGIRISASKSGALVANRSR